MQEEDNFVTNIYDNCHVNAALKNIRIHAFSNYALYFKKDITQGDSGSIYDNIYINSDDWDGETNVYTAKGGVYFQNTSATFHELNIEGSNYSSNLIEFYGINSCINIDILHVEGQQSLKQIAHLYNNCYLNIGNINMTRCKITTEYMSLFYVSQGSSLTVDSLKGTACEKTTTTLYLIGGSNTIVSSIGYVSINSECSITARIHTPSAVKLIYGKNGIQYTQQYQSLKDSIKKYNWIMDAGLNTSNFLYGKVCYMDNNNNIRYPDGNFAYYNDKLIRTYGTNEKKPDLTNAANNVNIGFKYFNTDMNMNMTWTGRTWVADKCDNVQFVSYFTADNLPRLIKLEEWCKYESA